MKSIYLKSYSNQLRAYYLSHEDPSTNSIESIKQEVFDAWGIPAEEQALYHNGRLIHNISGLQSLCSGSVIDVNLSLKGGKGGFGSLLRGQAISKRKITNFDASRDLQGRRIRDVKHRQKIEEWAKKKRDEEKIIKKEVDEYKKVQKEVQSTQKDIRLAQEFKDKVEKWDNELGSSIRAGARRTKKPQSKKQENSFELDDFEEPQRRKKVCTEELRETTITEKLDGTGEVLNVKITQKLAKIIEIEAPEASEIIQSEGKQEEQKDGQQTENNGEKVNAEDEKKKEEKVFPEIDLNAIKTMDDLVNLGADHLKHELMRLGLKCGGNLQEKAKRLYEIKCKPELLFHPKYIAKK